MGWEWRGGRRRYYTRSIRRGGHVVREYVGSGLKGDIAAAEDAARRAQRANSLAADRAERDQRNTGDAALVALDSMVERIVRTALSDAGYHQHDRGAWRRRRG